MKRMYGRAPVVTVCRPKQKSLQSERVPVRCVEDNNAFISLPVADELVMYKGRSD